jgi:two-component system response regulator
VTAPAVRTLLAEDNPADVELILATLETERLADQTHVARDGVEALDFLFCRGPHEARISVPPPRLAILDVKLPMIGGLEVLRQLRTDLRTRTVPVVLLTSSNIRQDVSEAYRLGANSYVQKPVDFGAFRDAIRLLGSYWLTVNEPPPPMALVPKGR